MYQARFNNPAGGEHAERNWKVVRRAGLADIGGCQIHGDPMTRKLEAGIPDGCSNTIAAFPHTRVWKANHREDGKPERHVHFNEDLQRLDTEDGRAAKARKHQLRGCKLSSERPYGEDLENPIVMDADFPDG